MKQLFLSRLRPATTSRLAWVLGWLLLLTSSHGAWAQLSGAYTINSAVATGARNYASFTDAVTQLNTVGVNGAVTFTVSGGPYTEQIILNAITGASATNTVTFNGGNSTIQSSAGTSAQRAVIQFNGATWVTINNLNINASGGTYGWGVLVTNASDNNAIKNCTITTDVAATTTNFAGIVVSGSTTLATTAGSAANNLTLQGNTITGGYYGITVVGASATALATGNKILNNVVREFYFYGIYASYQSGAQIIGNDMSRLTRATVSSFYGVYLVSGASKVAIEKNRIHDPFTGVPTSTSGFYGIYLTSASGTAGNENDVINNLIYNVNGAGIQYGLYNFSSAYARYYNNTVALDDQGASASTTYGYYQSSTSGAGIEIKNNIISVTRNPTGAGAKYALYFSVTSPAITSDYNDLYVGTGTGGAYYTGYATTAYATLAAWKGAGYDLNSVQANPIFINPAAGNYTPTNVALNNAGTPLTRVTDDITGAARGTAPDLGAYEFTPVATDLAAVALVSPTAGTGCYGATQTIVVQVRNAGTTTLDFTTNLATVTAVVTLPGGTTQTLTGTLSAGTLASGATQNVTLNGSFSMVALGTYGFAVTATVTGDQNTSNDALTPASSITVSAPVAGTAAASTSQICQSGATTLTLTGALNGAIQWQQGSSATGTFTDISGATSATYTTPVLTTTSYYRAQVRCNANTATSNVVTVTVNTPAIASTNSPVSVCQGSTATLTATAAAGVNIRFFSTATGGTALTGATTSGTTTSVITPAITASGTYYAEAYTGGQENVGKPLTNGADGTNQSGGLYFTATSAVTISTVTVYRTANAVAGTATIYLLSGSTTSTTGALATATVTIPANTTAAVSPTVVTLNFNVPAAGNYTLYLGAATPNLIRDNATAVPAVAYPYTSPSGTVTITGPTLAPYYYFFFNWQIGSECVASPRTAIQVNMLPGTPSGFSYASTTYCQSSTATPTPTITGTSGGTFTSSAAGLAVNASTGALNLSTATPGTYTITYTVSASGSPCPGSSTATVTVTAPQSAAFTYATGNYCAGSTGTITPTLATGATAGTFSSTTGLSLNATTGAISLASSAAGTYTVTNTVAAANGCAAATATQTVVIGAAPATPTITTANGATTVCSGGSLVLTAATNTTGASYQYSLNGNVIPGATSAAYTATAAGSYTVTVTGAGGCSATSAATVLTTIAAPATPTITTANGATTVCSGGSLVLTAATNTTGVTYQWLLNGNVIPGATSATYTATAAGSYTVLVTGTGNCSATSAATVLTLTPAPAVPTLTTPNGATAICGSSSIALTASTTTTGVTYQYLLNGVAIAGATSATYTATAAGSYTVVATNATGCSATSAATVLTSATVPSTATITVTGNGNSNVICGSGSLLLVSSAPVGNQWYLNGNVIAGATGPTYTATAAGTYSVVVTNAAGCSSTSVLVMLTASALPATPTITATTQPSGAILLTSSATTGNQFYLNGVAIAGATGQTYLVLSGNLSGSYTVVATSAAGCSSAPSTAVNVVVTATAQAAPGTSLSVAPNPSSGVVTLTLLNVKKASTLLVLNALGQEVYTQALSATAVQAPVSLNLSNLATGVYLVRVSNADGVLSQRLVRE